MAGRVGNAKLTDETDRAEAIEAALDAARPTRALVQIIVPIPPRYSPAIVSLCGPSSREIAEAVMRLTGHGAGELRATGRKGTDEIELRERADVGPGMLVAVIDHADGPDLAKALQEIERSGIPPARR